MTSTYRVIRILNNLKKLRIRNNLYEMFIYMEQLGTLELKFKRNKL